MAKSQETKLKLTSCSIIKTCRESFPSTNSFPFPTINLRLKFIIQIATSKTSPSPEVVFYLRASASLRKMSLRQLRSSISLKCTGLDNHGRKKLLRLVWNKLLKVFGDKPITETKPFAITVKASAVRRSGGSCSASTSANKYKSDDGCVICLEDLCGPKLQMELICGHLFHLDCIDEWKRFGNTCPICRDNISGDGLLRVFLE